MAEQSVTVAPGQVTTLAVALAAGTTIYNGDQTNAVWISGNPTPGPGQGMRIGPKGSLSWSAGGSPAYAAGDTDVTAPVVLTLSPNVSALDNPVDVGVAVALQLGEKGVPISNPDAIALSIGGIDLKLGSSTSSAIGAAVAANPLGLTNTATAAIGTAIAAQSLTVGNAVALSAATQAGIGSAVAAPSAAAIGTAVAANPLNLTNTATAAIGTAIAAQSLTIGSPVALDAATQAGIGSAVAAPSAAAIGAAVAAPSAAAIGTAVAAPTASAIATAVAGKSLTIGNTAAIGTAVAANALSLNAATTTAIGTAVASQSLTIGSVTGGNLNIVNTSAIGSSVATNIYNQGVPAVFQGSMLFSKNGTGGSVWLDVSAWHSVTVYYASNGAGQFDITWLDPTSNLQINDRSYLMQSGTLQFVASVKAPQLWIPPLPTGTQIMVYGSNRDLGDKVLNCDPFSAIAIASRAYTAGSIYYFPVANAITTDGGLWNFAIRLSSAVNGYLAVKMGSTDGLILYSAGMVADGLGNTGGNFQVALPPGRVLLGWLPITSATYVINITGSPVTPQ